jgi:hypothetical protein
MANTYSPHIAGRFSALFLVIQYCLMLTTFIVLSSAINWPVSLDDPASIALPRVIEFAGTMQFGYLCYLAVAILLIPATAALNARLGLTGALANTTMALATLSAIAKCIGISRWLFAMPVLAKAYEATGADKDTIATIFELLNAYAGNIGEVIGVGLISGIWTMIIAWAIYKQPGRFTKFFGLFIAFTGLCLLASVPGGFGAQSMLGIAIGDILTLNGFLWQHGLLAIGLWSLTTRRQVE